MIAEDERGNDTNVAVEQLAVCPWCGSPTFRQKWTSYDRLHLTSRQTFDYQQCGICDLLFQSPRPVQQHIYRFYPDDYGPYHAAPCAPAAVAVPPASTGKRLFKWTIGKVLRVLIAVTDCLMPRSFERRYADFYRPRSPGMELLDYGCGSDRFLNHARSLGWRTTGMDFSEKAVEQARASGHRAFCCNDDAWELLADGSLDFVRLSHVLEHLYQPRDVLSQLNRKMAPGAMLHLALPNPRSLSARVFGSYWFSLDCPRHIMLYTGTFLSAELPQLGFRVERVLHEPVTKDFARSWAYRQFDHKRISHDQIEGFLHRRLLNDALTVPLRLLAGLGCGERIHVFARKT